MLIQTAFALLIFSMGQQQQLAFPGAEGAGCFAKGGRGGRVIEVTNLNDSGPGSLRLALEVDGPRIVVFRLSGTIELRSTLKIKNPRITIAGQTAPGDGICLKNYGLSISADDVVVRYMRFRPGDNQGKQVDAISINQGRNIIVDHCSTSWAVDETLSASTSGQLANVTVQWCIISESLNCSVHPKGCHGYGSLIRGGWGNQYSFHHNLYAHHKGRNPRPGNYNSHKKDPRGFTLDFRNNVIYNWKGTYAGYNADADSITKMNFVGNYYKKGPDSTGDIAFREKCTLANAWFAGNFMSGKYPENPWDLVTFSDFTDEQKNFYKLSSPVPVTSIKIHNAVTAFKMVMADAGATLPKRDSVDNRIVQEVTKGTGQIIDDEQQVGGWPLLQSVPAPTDSDHDGMSDVWEKEKGLDPSTPRDGSEDRDSDGYTNVEEYLNALCSTTGKPK
ncbi:MAG: pectate lyase family protein [Planctomycetota bacterium]|jgi:pectate lyase